MGTKVRVTELRITFEHGQQFVFAIEDAKQLYLQLRELFEKDKETVFVPSAPIVIERDKWPTWYPPFQPCDPPLQPWQPHVPPGTVTWRQQPGVVYCAGQLMPDGNSRWTPEEY